MRELIFLLKTIRKARVFLTLLDQLSQAWEHNHEDIVKQAEEIERVIQKMNDLQREPHQSMMSNRVLKRISAINQRLDTQYGGCIGAPKFPPYATLRLLMAEKTFDHVHLTLEQMALSGLYDQVEGGFIGIVPITNGICHILKKCYWIMHK